MSQAPNELPLPHEEPDATEQPTSDAALALIRQKLARAYGDEPAAIEEEKEITAIGAQSKHQKFIQQLMASGKDIATVQTAWHNYYQGLTDREKHEVWQEFYANHSKGTVRANSFKKPVAQTESRPPQQKASLSATFGQINQSSSPAAHKTGAEIKKELLGKVSGKGKLKKKHHVQSVLFGLGMGMVVILIFMFGFFNERFIAPFITPSRTVSDTPIIIDPIASNAVGPENKVIIPKVNVEVPVVYDVPGITEKDMQSALERGVVHYPQSPVPGQNGNVVVVGHSSNNIFNKGKYKFAFVLLSKLQEGDTFMLNYNGQRFVYKIYSKKIVKPNDVAVLGPADRPNTATLITCDPPGTALNRLVLVGEQISPEPSKNVAATQLQSPADAPQELPGNAESLFHRLFGWLSS